MDVKGATKQKIAEVKEELSALFRKEKSFDQAREDLRTFLRKDSTKKVIEYITMCIPPTYNILNLAKFMRSDASLKKKVVLGFENTGAYAAGGAMWSFIPAAAAAGIFIGLYAAIAPVEWLMIDAKRAQYLEENWLRGGKTVGYIRMEDKGEKKGMLHNKKKLSPVWYPVDHPLGKSNIVGYRKLINGKIYDYYPDLIADSDTKTAGDQDWKNWSATAQYDRGAVKLGYFVVQAQVLVYSAIGYMASLALTGGKGLLPWMSQTLGPYISDIGTAISHII